MSGPVDIPKRLQTWLDATDEELVTGMVTKPRREVRAGDDPPRSGRYALPDHLILLQREHAGRPLVLLLHAALVVLIRRDLMPDEALSRFYALWDRHEAVLLSNLSLRWLVSAADTFADHGRTPAERSCALSTALLVNTIKFYETERVLSMNLDPTAADLAVQTPQFDLDGITPFNVANGDTAGNLFKRKDRVVADLGVTGSILSEVMRRSTEMDTVYSRFRKLHKSRRNAWWGA